MDGEYDRLRVEVRRRLADNIRKERSRLGLTQEKTAELVGFSLAYVQQIEWRKINVPLDTIVRFAYAFGVGPEKLLEATPDG